MVNPVPAIMTDTWWMCRSNRLAWSAALVLLAYFVLVAPFAGLAGLLVLVPLLGVALVLAGRPRITLTHGQVVVCNAFRTHHVPLTAIASADTASGGISLRTADGATVTGFALRHANLFGRRSVDAKWTRCADAIRLAAYQASQAPQAGQAGQ